MAGQAISQYFNRWKEADDKAYMKKGNNWGVMFIGDGE